MPNRKEKIMKTVELCHIVSVLYCKKGQNEPPGNKQQYLTVFIFVYTGASVKTVFVYIFHHFPPPESEGTTRVEYFSRAMTSRRALTLWTDLPDRHTPSV